MSRPVPPSPADQGRLQLLLALAVIFALSVIPAVSRLLHGDAQRRLPDLISAVLTALLLVWLYRGARPALYLTLALSIGGGVLTALLSVVGGFTASGLAALLAGLAFAAAGIAIATLPGIQAFLAWQRGRAR
ncbi:hypothetical protein [Deinococcus sonorensis]|uniref:Uncharacterized protein n=2 Tax=Deinococcus sonorensis TaxID=309891 RepID=A0AAU7UAU7_9DEIO